MSYGFKVTASSREDAKAKIETEFDRVLESQPVHKADLPAARVAAAAYVDILAEPADGQEVEVNVSGYVSWQGEGHFTGSRIEVRAQIQPKPQS